MKAIQLFHLLTGLMDFTTGILLLLAPLPTLALMGIQSMPAEPIYLSWIGVFVASVGFFYLRIAFYDKKLPASEWRLTWQMTALIRMAVALFLARALWAGQLELAWSSVALTDGGIALYQFLYLIPNLKRFHPRPPENGSHSR